MGLQDWLLFSLVQHDAEALSAYYLSMRYSDVHLFSAQLWFFLELLVRRGHYFVVSLNWQVSTITFFFMLLVVFCDLIQVLLTGIILIVLTGVHICTRSMLYFKVCFVYCRQTSQSG